ncbi:hypothetical protein ERX46_13830 [Brumimicrobium glaciale]|uniref:Lipoprotein n=1 Tax=Brumimicrobium glaciale TaxID=200475 RepID=A0A4Q4KHN3_9FLAO|nr:hypothetical protein [Brumimicrobium glaciale]RYM32358.1 hypothetical protein ERX46_13830 [Brumimicrobium glaciale]
MKNLLLLALSSLLFTSCYHRIGDLTLVSNQNYDSSEEYVMIAQNVEGKAKSKKGDPLETAIDNVVIENNGNHLRNAKIFVKKNGQVIKVVGDVYGDKRYLVDVVTSVVKDVKLEIGDTVSFKSHGRILEGKILGLNSEAAIVEFTNSMKKTVKKEIKFADLTKLGK